MNHDIFISYSSKQKSIADGVCHYLEENGFKCWMAPRDIPVGSDYGDLIEEAIKTSKVVVLVFSQTASISKWVKGEINVAFTEDKSILPFRVDETEIKGGFRLMLNQMHWIDAFPHYADRLPDLLSSICGFLGRQPQKISIDVEHLEAERKDKEAAEREKSNREQNATYIINGHEYVDLGLPSGTLWATCNVGAEKPEDYGCYFAWGETRQKVKYSWITYKYKHGSSLGQLTKYCDNPDLGYNDFTDNLTNLEADDDAATFNWGSGWRMPVEAEWQELFQNTSHKYITQKGKNGCLFIASNGNSLFLPAAGYEPFCNVGSSGYYWTSLLCTDRPTFAKYFYFTSNKCCIYENDRFRGLAVRPVYVVK